MYIYCIACSIKKAVSFWTQKAPLVTAEKEMTADEKVTAGSQNGRLKTTAGRENSILKNKGRQGDDSRRKNDGRQSEQQTEKRRQAVRTTD